MNNGSLELESRSPEETEAIAFALAALLPQGAFISLRGDLAAGKTCFTRGLVKRLAPEEQVTSPTFTIVNEYEGASRIYHVDLYRLETLDEVRGLGYEDIFAPPEGITIVEWAERAESLLPAARIDVAIEHAGTDRRHIKISNGLPLASNWRVVLQEAAGSLP